MNFSKLFAFEAIRVTFTLADLPFSVTLLLEYHFVVLIVRLDVIVIRHVFPVRYYSYSIMLEKL